MKVCSRGRIRCECGTGGGSQDRALERISWFGPPEVNVWSLREVCWEWTGKWLSSWKDIRPWFGAKCCGLRCSQGRPGQETGMFWLCRLRHASEVHPVYEMNLSWTSPHNQRREDTSSVHFNDLQWSSVPIQLGNSVPRARNPSVVPIGIPSGVYEFRPIELRIPSVKRKYLFYTCLGQVENTCKKWRRKKARNF